MSCVFMGSRFSTRMSASVPRASATARYFFSFNAGASRLDSGRATCQSPSFPIRIAVATTLGGITRSTLADCARLPAPSVIILSCSMQSNKSKLDTQPRQSSSSFTNPPISRASNTFHSSAADTSMQIRWQARAHGLRRLQVPVACSPRSIEQWPPPMLDRFALFGLPDTMRFEVARWVSAFSATSRLERITRARVMARAEC